MRTKEEVIEEYRCQAIREAAIRVVARKGFAHATVQDIADEAGVAKGTVYLYFKSREEILEKAFAASVDELLKCIKTASCGGDFVCIIESVIRTQLQFFEERQEFFRLYLAMAEPLGEKRLRKHAGYRSHIAQLTQMVEDATARGEIASGHLMAERTAIAIAAVVRDIVLQRITEKNPRPIEEDVRFARDFVCHGVLSKEKR